MNKRVSFLALCAGLILLTATGCVVNKAIPQSAIADNLAIEKAQNEMLLLNVLRAKDHNPMVVTGISKITGSIKAEASLNASIPIGSFRGDGSKSASNYVVSPGATYNWNPSFDVNVFDTSEFMHGFLMPVPVEKLAYYWNLGFYKQVLLNLMVLKVDFKKVSGCNDAGQKMKPPIGEFTLPNNHEWSDTPSEDLNRFPRWIYFFLETAKPYFEEGKAERLGPTLGEAQAQKALIKGLTEGLTLVKVEDQKFQFERVAPPKQILRIKGEKTLKLLYNWPKDNGLKEDSPGRTGDATDCSPTNPVTQPGGTSSQLTREIEGDQYTITFFLRSPEAILYYLGELARIEIESKRTAYYCLDGKRQPLFVVRRSGECGSKSVVQATNADGESYVIPAAETPPPECVNREPAWEENQRCDGGRSMEALTVISQLIALQKSAKDLPTTSVVRVIGQ